MGRKGPLYSLLLKTPHPSGDRASPRQNDTGGLGSGGCWNHLGETREEVAGSICLEMRDRAQSRGGTGAKIWALEGAGFPRGLILGYRGRGQGGVGWGSRQ